MDLIVAPDRDDVWRAWLGAAGGWRCAIGRGGIRRSKREGDGATPIGRWPLRRVLYRPDRVDPPETALPTAALSRRDAWCDDPAHAAYNRPVRLPFEAGHEVLWREDGLYDIIVVPAYNDEPPVPGAGSAIFLHVAHPDYACTAGCVALARGDLLAALHRLGPGDGLQVRERAGAGAGA